MKRSSAAEPGPDREATAAKPSLVLFFAGTFALSWSLWLVAQTVGVPALRSFLFLAGVFSPAMVALVLTAGVLGQGGVRSLLRPVIWWQTRLRWYAVAVGYMASIKLVAAVAHRAAEGRWPAFNPAWGVLLIGVLVSTPFQIGEELGWRGFSLPRLSESFGLRRSALLLGVIWAFWHLPLFFIADTGSTGQPFVPYLLSITAISVALAWLFAKTGGSLLLVMLMHSAVNHLKDIVPYAALQQASPFLIRGTTMTWLTTAVLWIAAGYFLVTMPKKIGETPRRSASIPRT